MQAPRGTRDFGPKEMAARRGLEQRLRHVLRTYNYHEVQTPAFEELELFLAKSGPGIRDEIYDFKDKSGRELSLRPELTAPTMRFYFSNLKMEPKPLRLFYFGPCYRYDRPQAGRYREFWQLGIELLGDETPQAHAEVLRLALQLFEEAGLKNFVLRVGHLGILRSLLEEAGVKREDQAPLMRFIDKKDLASLEKELTSRGGAQSAQTILRFFELTTLDELRPLATKPDATAAFAHLEATLGALKALGADMTKVRIDPTIARGLEYYTGLVFELDAPDLGAEKQLLGGGAYDLSGVFQETPIASMGFALGFDRTLVALERTSIPVDAPVRVDVILGALVAEAWPEAARLAQTLRKTGRVVELESQPVGVKKLLSRASQLRAKHAVFLGTKELERKVVAVKNLETGVQSELPAAELPTNL
jgi:histidyl-tRNA synthetase